LTAGSTLTTVGDAAFFLDDPLESLIVSSTFPETLWMPNYVGDSGISVPGEQLDEFQAVSIGFGTVSGVGRSVIGLWVQFDPSLAGNTGSCDRNNR
jgi:hypothetical protein